MSIKAIIAAGGVSIGGVLLYLAFRSDDGEPAKPLPDPVFEPPPSTTTPVSDDDVEALARVIDSEARSESAAVRRAIGWVVRNRFRGLGKSIYSVEYPWREQKGSDPPFASARPASDGTYALAREILAADQSDDPTGGATSFFEPKLQDVLVQAGALARAGETGLRVIDGVKISDITRFKSYKKTADVIRKSWSKGSALYAVAGPFELWGSRKFARAGGTVQMIGRIPRAFELRRQAPRQNNGLQKLGKAAIRFESFDEVVQSPSRVVVSPPKKASVAFTSPVRVAVSGGKRSVPPQGFSANTINYEYPTRVVVTSAVGPPQTFDNVEWLAINGGKSSIS